MIIGIMKNNREKKKKNACENADAHTRKTYVDTVLHGRQVRAD